MRGKALAVLLGVGFGCHGATAPETRPAAGPAPAASAEPVAQDLDAEVVQPATPALEEGMPRLAVVLDDPRLAAARERARAHDPSGAARTLDAVRATATLDPAQTCSWSYAAGRLHLDAGEASDASAAFERVLAVADDAGAPCTLAPYASLRDAQALLRLARPQDAIARARAVGDEVAARDEARLVLADAFVARGDRASAVSVWREILAASPHGVRWADTSIQLATALLDGVDGSPQARAQEALDLATRAFIEAPWTAEKVDLASLRARAASLLKRLGAPPLTPDERVRQAQAWADATQPKRATEAVDALLEAIPKQDKKHHATACRAAVIRAQAVPRGKAGEAADAWGEAIDRCEGEEDQVTALYYGGKASSSAHRNAESVTRFDRVEKRFPKHRLADDARFHAALVVYDEGDEAKYLSMLASVPDTYPDGDMKGEALFRLAIARLGKHNLDAARTALDRLLAYPPDDHAWGAAGRAAYYRARVAQLSGDVADARNRYTAIVADEPLSFPMLMAYARLRALDDAGARAALQAAVAREPGGPFLTREHAELSSPAFDRFVRLLEVGEIDAARHEAASAGLTAEGVDPEVLWTIAWLYDRAGAPELGHSFARSRLVDYRAHWPAGRWRLPWQVAFPRPWDDVVGAESSAAGIPPALTWAIMREESAFNPDAHSAANAYGLMQLLLGTARLVARGTSIQAIDEPSLRRPEVSIALGTRLLASLRSSFPANPSLAIAAYNGGSGAVRRWLGERGADDFDLFVERIPYDETRNYLKRVLSSEAAYAYLYAPQGLDELLALPQRAAGPEPPSPGAP